MYIYIYIYIYILYYIVDDPKELLLNKRSEAISQCRHRNKYKLKKNSCM